MAGLASLSTEITEAGGRIIAVSPDQPEQNGELIAKLGLDFPVLSDPEMEVTDLYGVRHLAAMGAKDLPYPTTFVIDAAGMLRRRFDNATYQVRPEPRAVTDALLEVISGV